ncbi:MAG: hypothetical protein P8H13_02095 [Polaribacter sp.]|nr:hypothetical protein [Polaribacter sp.]MDG1810713.1 hypothetical protein [Polaribacter sp.]MDG1993296.1 hypothetical protein [Polaribacter sp.]
MKIKSIGLLLLFVLISKNTFGQQEITWQNVVEIYAKEFRLTEKNPTSVLNANTLSLKDVANKKITIKGYFLDLDPNGEWYILSKNPFATCFFCGKAGPETVLELLGFKNEKKKFKSDDLVEVTGVFNTIYTPEGKVSFVLEQASLKLINN